MYLCVYLLSLLTRLLLSCSNCTLVSKHNNKPGVEKNMNLNVVYFSPVRDKHQSKPTLRDLQNKFAAGAGSHPALPFVSDHAAPPPNCQPKPGATLLDTSPSHLETPSADVTLANVSVPLESIKPSK